MIMQRNKDRSKMLNELYKVSKMGMEASEEILLRTHGDGLRAQIKKQDERYINLMEKSVALLKQQHEQPIGVSQGTQNMLRGAIKANTFFRHNPQHIAELMVRGTAMGIVGVTKVLNHVPDCDVKTRQLAEDYINTEERNVDSLKGFL
jgi:hypothetical protein